MPIEFAKYQGTGNDFILINNFNRGFNKSNIDLIKKMCNRKFGIGADGLMLLEKVDNADFELIFFNPDASLSFCGNGSRCAVKFAHDVGIINKFEAIFTAFDGLHNAKINSDLVTVSMRDIENIEKHGNDFFINTGAPHVVTEVDNIDAIDIISIGSRIRYDEKYKPIGTNVNFIQSFNNGIAIRTYEKGVENETLSCGTGVTASALAYAAKNNLDKQVEVLTKGGTLIVSFKNSGNIFTNVSLTGPAEFVFKGYYDAKLFN